MLILLPPSEGKTRPESGSPLDLAGLDFPQLTKVRERILNSLVKLSAGKPERAMEVLGLGKTLAEAVTINANLRDESTARADEIYTGVLFEALDLPGLEADTRKRADASIAIASGLFGLLRPYDRIPPYRLSGNVTLPRLGTVAGLWRPRLPDVFDQLAGDGLMIDLRSGAYVNLGKPGKELAARTAAIRVLHESDGKRSVVSHFNKATKGRVVRALLTENANPNTIDELVEALSDLGWTVERQGVRLDVIVTRL